MNYSEARTRINEVAERITQNRKRVEQSATILQQAVNDLTNAQTQYGDLVAMINNAASEDATNEAWKVAAAEIDHLAGEFISLKTAANAKLTAVNEAR